MENEKISFDQTFNYDRMNEYVKIDQMKKMLDTLYAGPKKSKATTTRDVMMEHADSHLISEDSQQTSSGEDNASHIHTNVTSSTNTTVNAFSRRHGIHSKTKKRYAKKRTFIKNYELK